MTSNYNATEYTTLRYFYSNIWGEISDMSKSERQDFILEANIFNKNFYKFLTISLFKVIFKKDRSTFLRGLDHSSIRVGKNILNLNYYSERSNKERKVFKYMGKRLTVSKAYLSDNLNNKLTERALDPNLIQAHDAELVMFVVCRLDNIFTVHDCFGTNI
jgi:hypothetical protein